MANTPVVAKANTGTGTDAFASDLISGTNWPYSKIAFGPESTATAVSASDPLPVDIGTPTVSLSAGSLSALENITVGGTVEIGSTSLAALESITVGGTVELGATSLAALESITATGPLTDTQLRAAEVPVSVAGVATETTLSSINSELNLIEGYFKAEDAPAVSGDKGLPLLAMRQLADTTSTDADGDYTLVKIDEEGRVKVATKPASFALVTGNITANAQTVFCDVSRASNVQIHMVATSLVGHNVTFEGSLDSTNGTDGAWFGIQVIRSNANTIELTTGVLAATPAYAWEASVNGLSFIRVRATAHTSGTATWKFQRGSYATEPIPAAQISGTQPVSGTVTATVTAGTVNPVVPATPYFVNSAASTNGALILTGTSGLHAFYATNEGASAAYVKLYNKATAPTVGTDVPEMIIPVPAAVGGVPGVATLPIGFGAFRFPLGLGIAITRNAVFSDTTAVGAGEVKVKLSRTV